MMATKMNAKTKSKTNPPPQKKSAFMYASLGISLVVMIVLIVLFSTGGGSPQTNSPQGNAKDLIINKSEITSTVQFIPYQFGNTNMEIMAVQAPDGSVRTAFNTCQVCFDSGRGYYKQEGDEVVCQNCGNRFQISQIELVRNGCNPVPIDKTEKTEDADTITITSDFLAQNTSLFARWKR